MLASTNATYEQRKTQLGCADVRSVRKVEGRAATGCGCSPHSPAEDDFRTWFDSGSMRPMIAPVESLTIESLPTPGTLTVGRQSSPPAKTAVRSACTMSATAR